MPHKLNFFTLKFGYKNDKLNNQQTCSIQNHLIYEKHKTDIVCTF